MPQFHVPHENNVRNEQRRAIAWEIRGMFVFVDSLVSISDVPIVVEAFFHLTELVTTEAVSL